MHTLCAYFYIWKYNILMVRSRESRETEINNKLGTVKTLLLQGVSMYTEEHNDTMIKKRESKQRIMG